ncbi:MAG TPA: hypothetical protein VFE47_12440 [Tepidisphaeraceae bacterium]|jgi:hypothetical protein|nr:hypothetical protein [Tepidisphaeraceae bacterium]
MAKAKKTAPASAPATEAAAAKPAKKKKAPAKAAAPAQTAEPMIDTNLAAAMAAKRLVNREELAAAGNAPHTESAAFKQMKENLHKPTGQNTPGFLQTPMGGKKFNNSVPGRHQQLGRNQTFGADVNRTGVPRRTGG